MENEILQLGWTDLLVMGECALVTSERKMAERGGMCYNEIMLIVGLIVGLAILGAMMGSFACCQAWRMRMRLTDGRRKMPARSCCMKCRRKLAWYENIPVFSWLWLRGRCRGCGAKIGVAEILMEVGGAAAFVGAYAGVIGVWNDAELGAVDGWAWGRLVCLLVLLVLLGVLAVYDGKWGEMPVVILFVAVLVAGAVLVCREVPLIVAGVDMRWEALSVVVAVMLTAGLYFLLSHCSGGRLMGDGDWLLGLALGLALADWWLALILLALSNLLAALYGLTRRKHKIYFGPFFVIAFVLIISMERIICLSCMV